MKQFEHRSINLSRLEMGKMVDLKHVSLTIQGSHERFREPLTPPWIPKNEEADNDVVELRRAN